LLNRTESVIEPTQAPEFKTPIKDQLGVREGGFAHFEARLEPMGDHTMKVEWYKDGNQVDASSRITTFFNFGYVALTIKQVNQHDAGNYTCVAYNKCGKAETAAKMSTLTAADGEMQSKTWSSIQQMEMSKQKVTSISVMQEQPTVAPRFVSQLKGTNVILEGQRAHFECRIEPQNDSNLKVQWLLNGTEVKASSRIQTYNDFGYVAIDILDAQHGDQGTYTLVATNALGSEQATIDLRVEAHKQVVDTSTIHTKAIEETRRFEMKQEVKQFSQEVTMQQSSPLFRTPLQNPQPVMEGQNIHLEARLEPIGDPGMKVEWFFNGMALTIGANDI
jgi:titin